MQIEYRDFEIYVVNKIYVPWKAKKAVISCFLTFIVYFPSTYTRPARLRSLEEQLSALSILLYKSPVFFIAFIYYICKIYFSNDKFLFWAWSLKKLSGYW